MEHSDLVDPTESRYASVAQEMVLSNDWLTPRLPSADGITPYFSKPPLHYWITATIYDFFGIDEWTARLPSLLASILILCVIIEFGRKYFNSSIGVSAGLIAMSSGVFFFLAGASVVDVTLTACCSVAIFYCYQFISTPSASIGVFLLGTIWASLAFLCKGPIAFVFIVLPFLCWSGALRDFSWLSRIPWIRSIALASIIIVPWFMFCEMHNPGFMKYFFWNENFARYLFRHYGDRYGSGHRHVYGTSWLMLLGTFFPWTLVLGWTWWRQGVRQSYAELQSNKPLLFALCWGVSSAIFFTFARQLHIMYLLPGIAGLSLVTAVQLLNVFSESRASWKFPEKTFVNVVILCSGVLVCTYLSSILLLTPFINSKRSAELMLKEVANAANNSDVISRIGIASNNQYSINWTARAWENELKKKVEVKYVEPDQIFSHEVDYLLLKTGVSSEFLQSEMKQFSLIKKMEKWELYRKFVP